MRSVAYSFAIGKHGLERCWTARRLILKIFVCRTRACGSKEMNKLLGKRNLCSYNTPADLHVRGTVTMVIAKEYLMAMPQTNPSRRVTPVHMLLEALAGCVSGLLCGGLVGVLAARLFMGSSSGWGDLIGAVLGAIAGYVLGASLGVWLVGRRLHGSGAYWLSLVGSVGGAALVFLLAEPLHLNSVPIVLQSALVLTVPIAATLAFHSMPRH